MSTTPYPEIRYNQVRQKSSHNSYQRSEGLYDQFLYWRLRSLEVDIHTGKSGRPALDGDWYIYHGGLDTRSSVDRLSDLMTLLQGLARTVPEHEIATLFVDLKSGWSATHSPEAFDRLLLDGLGRERIFAPADLGGSSDLQAEVTANGWPHLAQMRGKFAFVLTGGSVDSAGSKLNSYVDDGATAGDRLAFIAPRISTPEDVTRWSYVVYFNLEDDQAEELGPVIFDRGFVSRAYTADSEDEWGEAERGKIHVIATNKVNARSDPWSHTDNAAGWPFQGIEIAVSPELAEPGTVYGVEAASGEIWGREDSLFYFFREGFLREGSPGGGVDGTADAFLASPASHVPEDARGCLMARASLAADAPYLAIVRHAENAGPRLQVRLRAGEETQEVEGALPAGIDENGIGFARIAVSGGGSRAEGWISEDGADWLSLGTFDFAEPLALVGYAASSDDPSEVVKFLFFPLEGGAGLEPQAEQSVGEGVSDGAAFVGVYR